MNDRQRFLATMRYQQRDRCPICDFGFWEETLVLWYDQGLPRWVDNPYDGIKSGEAFGMDRYCGGPGIGTSLCPGFEAKVIEDRGDHEIVQQWDGVTVLRKKFMSSIPEHHGHLLTDRESWKKHYLPKLDPSTPERYPEWESALKIWRDPNRDTPVSCSGGSLYGELRSWMGVENLSMVVYDDPAWFEEMVTIKAECILGALKTAFAKGAQFDGCGMWEDMCYSGGPLLSPEHFKQYLVPHYKRITELLASHGVDIVWVDCDGNIEHLMPMWLDAGVNCMFPVEIGTWGADPVRYRKQYGKRLLMMGGFDKHIMATGKRAIDQEIKRLTPVVEEGGFIPFADHRVSPDVPLENYVYYLDQARKVWGRGVNLRPMTIDRSTIKPAPPTAH